MLIGPFRMYFVKKGVKWDLVDAHSIQPAAGSVRRHKRPQKILNFSLNLGAKCSTPAIRIRWNHVVVVEHAAPGSFIKTSFNISLPSWRVFGLRG